MAVTGFCACSSTPTATTATAPAPVPTGSSTVAAPGRSGVVIGIVTDSATRLPLAGALISWTGLAEAWGDRGHGVATDADGAYQLAVSDLGGPGSDEGLFMMRASKGGYVSQTVRVTLAEAVNVNFELRQVPRASGTVTWASIKTARSLCNEITSQVGQTYSLWLTAQLESTPVVLELAHHSPEDLFADPPGVFRGERTGDHIVASYAGPMGGLACRGDSAITQQVGGTLNATVASDEVSGDYTEVYGTGPDEVTFVFQFHATL
jgi:hypothetical protein